MEFTESLIKEYAKKIYGFAYSKTHDCYNAEDLSHDILTILCDQSIHDKNIDNINAYVYRICCYTWSNYLRKNKSQWEALNNVSVFDTMQSKTDIEENYIEKELCDKLRREIMYLSKTKREITVLFYYEKKSGDEISKFLNIPASTIRWYLSQTKIDLKERIEMNEENAVYKPVKLCVGHNGWVTNYDMNGLQSDVLMQNICWICHGKSLTIEQMARTLGVAAVYLEDKIEKLLYMDYLKKIHPNKYQTNFFILDSNFIYAQEKFKYEHTLQIAPPLYNALKRHIDDLKKIGFIGSALNDNYLMFALLPLMINDSVQRVEEKLIREKKLHYTTPKRKDGSEHWVYASFLDVDASDFTGDYRDYFLNGGGNGVKTRNLENMHSLQYDLDTMGGWREFNGEELLQLKRAAQIIKNNEHPNEYDKFALSNLIAKGYIEVRDDRPNILVPYFSRDQFTALKKLIDTEAEAISGTADFIKPFYDYADTINAYIPTFVDENERNFWRCGYDPQYTIMWLLQKNGYLQVPSPDEKKRICTVVWED